MYVGNHSTAKISSCLFESNHASSFGGAIDLFIDGNASISQSRFIGEHPSPLQGPDRLVILDNGAYKGGAFCVKNSSNLLTESSGIEQNSAKNGGGIELQYSRLFLIKTDLIGNVAFESGNSIESIESIISFGGPIVIDGNATIDGDILKPIAEKILTSRNEDAFRSYVFGQYNKDAKLRSSLRLSKGVV